MGVTVVNRDSQLKIAGEDPEGVMLAGKAIEGLMTPAARGESIHEQNVRYPVDALLPERRHRRRYRQIGLACTGGARCS